MDDRTQSHMLKKKYSRKMSRSKLLSTGKHSSEWRLAHYAPYSTSNQSSTPSPRHTTCGHLRPATLLSAQKALYWQEWPQAAIGPKSCADTGPPTEVATVEQQAVIRHQAPLSICWLSALHWRQSERDSSQCGWRDLS